MDNRDPLTSMPTREVFQEKFSRLFDQAAAEGQPLTLAFLDIDNFLYVNEDHGRTAGDAVLKTIAKLVRENSGHHGLAYRYGGDEFAILLLGLGREQAFLILERIRAAVEAQGVYADGGQEWKLRLTISGGLASYPVDGGTESEIFRKADQAFSRAKRTGRNKVLLAYEERMIPKTAHFTETQLERLADIAGMVDKSEASLLRAALDDLIVKYQVSVVGKGARYRIQAEAKDGE